MGEERPSDPIAALRCSAPVVPPGRGTVVSLLERPPADHGASPNEDDVEQSLVGLVTTREVPPW